MERGNVEGERETDTDTEIERQGETKRQLETERERATQIETKRNKEKQSETECLRGRIRKRERGEQGEMRTLVFQISAESLMLMKVFCCCSRTDFGS